MPVGMCRVGHTRWDGATRVVVCVLVDAEKGEEVVCARTLLGGEQIT